MRSYFFNVIGNVIHLSWETENNCFFLENIFGAFFVQAQPVFIHKKRNSLTKDQELGLTFYWEICCRIIKFCSDKEEVHANN